MKQKSLWGLITLLCIFLSNLSYGQQVSQETVNKLRKTYNSFPKHEISFDEFLKIHQKEAKSTKAAAVYTGCDKLTKFCANGDFESGLDVSKWQGGYSTWGSGDPDPFTFTEGFISGPLNSSSAHQTIVSTGTDPVTGIPLTPPGGGLQSLRIGNAINGYGTEFIAKTITVDASQTIFPFFYAVVFEDPGHAPPDQPAFSVRVFDCKTGLELDSVCDLGNGSNKAVSDAANPFFQDTIYNGGLIAYRNWSTAQINLSNYIGKKVNIIFLNKDCGLGGHFGYTYIDNLSCGIITDTSYNVILDTVKNDTCGVGQICTNYKLPQADTLTGNLTMDLDVYQNGTKLQTITSPLLTSGSSYCFSINPASFGLDQSLGGFDYVITGHFVIGQFALPAVIVGQPPNGQIPGANNDYQITCGGGGVPTPQCCSGTNLIKNPGFEQGNTGFTSQYNYESEISDASVKPGYYTIANSVQAAMISPTWKVNCPIVYGNHLYVNGLTGDSSKVIWRQDVPVERSKTYKFCMDVKNLAQRGFDVKPTIRILFLTQSGTVFDTTEVINVPQGPCTGDQIKQDIYVPGGSGTTALTIKIILKGNKEGDGNDLVIDNLSLVELSPVPIRKLLFNTSFFDVKGSRFSVSAHPVDTINQNCWASWKVAEVDASNNSIPGTEVNNPSAWMYQDPNMFNGYKGTSTLGDTTQPGIFKFGKRYRITYGRACTCASLNSYSLIIDATSNNKINGSASQIRVLPDPKQTGNFGVAQEVNAASVDKIKAVNEISVYPNPTKGNITVSFPPAGTKSKLIIYSAAGNTVKEISIKAGDSSANINTSTFGAGTYLIKLSNNNEAFGTKIFIKQ